MIYDFKRLSKTDLSLYYRHDFNQIIFGLIFETKKNLTLVTIHIESHLKMSFNKKK